MDNFFNADYLVLTTEDKDIKLKKKSDMLWSGGGIEILLSIKETKNGFSVSPTLSNKGKATVAIEKIEVIKTKFENRDKSLRFLRFGFNMPGDPVRFGTISTAGFNPPLYGMDAGFTGENKEVFFMTSNSMMALSGLDRKSCFIIGAGSFRFSEGTVFLSCSKKTGAMEISYEMILDGVSLKPGEKRVLDEILIIKGNDLNELLAEWAELTAAGTKPLIPSVIPTGWNDWQFYRNEKTQDDVLDSAEVLSLMRKEGYPLDFVQVDGGFCIHLSEWSRPKPGFSRGIKDLSERIVKKGLKFGLWFAPYIQNTQTNVVKEHPEWLLKNRENNKPVSLANSNVGPSCLIDYTVPRTIEWLRKQIRLFVDDWNVTWIKLDGPNYALYRQGRIKDHSKTISEMLSETFEVMREEAGPDVLIEGEGMMGLALGRVDMHRVQTDNHSLWYRNFDITAPYAPQVYGKELIMSFLHNRWWCNHRENIILRDYPSPLCHARTVNPNAVEQLFTDNEIKTQLAVAVLGSGGMLLTDPMKELERNSERMKFISQVLPVWPGAAEIVDVFPDARYPSVYKMKIELPFEEYTILGIINWSDETRDYSFSLKGITGNKNAGNECYAFSFFDEKLLGVFKSKIEVKGISAHACRVIALRKKENHPQLISTNMHLLQGAVDIASSVWDEKKEKLDITVKHFMQKDAKLFLGFPDKWKIKKIKTDALRYSVDDYYAEIPVIRFEGASGKLTSFSIYCEQPPG
ncbi:MAG: hypothetical protein A2017_00545 [Lentisphaerae bacterium GWF2_44_16]|nr:MAG: hypothetical protein A2017_00545 [Lentisphaerae bacterium GWF2_44_16]